MIRDRPPTNFENRVYDAVALIPKGRVASYGAVARYIGTRSALAVGQALKRHPNDEHAPCHRVVAGDFTLGGYSGGCDGESVDLKKRILLSEGVIFDEKNIIIKECRFDFEHEA